MAYTTRQGAAPPLGFQGTSPVSVHYTITTWDNMDARLYLPLGCFNLFTGYVYDYKKKKLLRITREEKFPLDCTTLCHSMLDCSDTPLKTVPPHGCFANVHFQPPHSQPLTNYKMV
jgi:hypothetical protein